MGRTKNSAHSLYILNYIQFQIIYFMNQLKFFKKGESAIFPKRGTKSSAGIDFYVPKPLSFSDLFLGELKSIIVQKLKEKNDQDNITVFLTRTGIAEADGDLAKFFWTHILWYNWVMFNNNLTLDQLLRKNSLTIPAGEHLIIPTGITANIPEGYCITMLNKSGIATKKSLLLGAQLIDEDYTGIIHIDIHNVSNDECYIEMGDKIAQGVIMESHCYDFELLNCEGENDKGQTERGAGGFGSTGTK